MIELPFTGSNKQVTAAIKDYYLKSTVTTNPEEEFPLIEKILQEQFDLMAKDTTTPMRQVGLFDYCVMTHYAPDPDKTPVLAYYSFLMVYMDPEVDINESEQFACSLSHFGFIRDLRKPTNQLGKSFYNEVDEELYDEVTKNTPLTPTMTRLGWLGYRNGIYHRRHFNRFGSFFLNALAQGT